MASGGDTTLLIGFFALLSVTGGACAGAPRRSFEALYSHGSPTPRFTWVHLLEAWIGGALCVLFGAGYAWHIANSSSGGSGESTVVGAVVLSLGTGAFLLARYVVGDSEEG